MLISALNGGVWGIVQLLLSVPIIIFSLSMHEAAHGYAAMKLGDPTAYNIGRVSLNPLRHLDPSGALAMLLVGVGWAKPVPINVRNFRDPRKGMMLSSLAGPLSNLLLGVVATILYVATGAIWNTVVLRGGGNETMYNFVYLLIIFFYMAGIMNFSLGIFNLIPCPPFDGSRILFYFLPKSWYFRVMQYERYLGIGLLVLILLLNWMLDVDPVSFLSNGLFDLLTKPLMRLMELFLSPFRA